MKAALIICIIALAGVLGYLAEPSLRPLLTGHSPAEDTADGSADDDRVIVLQAPRIDPATLSPEQLPKTITLKEAVQFTDKSSGFTMTMNVGSIAKLIRVEGIRAVVSPGETGYNIMIPINKTDLADQLAANPPQAVTVEVIASVPTPTIETAPEVASATPDLTAAVEPAPEVVTTPDDTPAPAPEVVTAPVTPAPVNSGPAESLSESDVVAIMKNSIMKKEIQEFGFDQVTEWKKGEIVSADGGSFNTGLATYKDESLFGTRFIEAQAFIQDGKVVKWVWPKSGIELK